MKRKPKRNVTQVKKDIQKSNQIVREDVYEIIKTTKSRSEAIKKITQTLGEMDQVSYQKSKDRGVARIVSDLDSYGIKWEL